jgi:uncharacterized protein
MIGKLQGNSALVLGAVGIFSMSLIAGGYLLGDGLRRAKSAERSISVRGVSERDVTANLATWTINFSRQGDDMASVNAQVDQQSALVRRFFHQAGFKPEEITDSGVSFDRQNLTDSDGRPAGQRLTVRRSVELRTTDVLRAKKTNERLAELLKQGVELEGSTLNFSFTRLNELKPPMIAEATRRARDSAEQFARDSGAEVGRIRSASQGYFSVGPRDGADSEEGSDGSESPFQKVRVVTTIDYDIAG